MELKQMVETLVKRLASEPDQVEIREESQGDQTVVFEARVSKQDMGRVIGKKGKTIEALRTIIGAFGVKQNKRFLFQLIEEED